MKLQLKAFFLSFLIGLSNILTPASAAPPMPGGHGQPMPSVGDIFGNMSQEQIIEQVQEAQKFFESLSPEEMAEVEKMVEDTLKGMSDQDFQDIQQIATMVEPHLDAPKQPDEPKQEASPATAKASEEKEKKDDVDVDTNNIQQLIDNINKHVSEVLQKAESSKELAEEVNHKWTSRLTFNNMNKQVLSLKESRLAKKLAKKENKEEQDLVEALQGLHSDISKHNKNFKVEDTFGVPESRQAEQKQLQTLQSILNMFDSHIDKVMPLTEKFLKKHDPEALMLAKESEERAKKAKQHAKEAEIKTGKAPAGSPEPVRGPGPGYPYPGSGRTPSEGGFIGTAGGDSDPALERTGTKGNLGDFAKGAKDSDKNKEKKGSADSSQLTLSPYKEVSNFFEDHVGMFDNKHEEDFAKFLQSEITNYPNPAKAAKPPTNPEDRSDWLTNEFTDYTNNAKQKASQFAREFKAVNDSLDDHLKSIAKISSDQELQKLADHKDMKRLKARLHKYKETYEKAKETINNVFQKNTAIDGNQAEPIKGPATLSEYKHHHRDFMQFLQTTLENPLVDAESSIDTIERKIKHQKRRLKNKS